MNNLVSAFTARNKLDSMGVLLNEYVVLVETIGKFYGSIGIYIFLYLVTQKSIILNRNRIQ